MESQPQNFENLRCLLALKRHEQPPPGYYDELRSEIFSRLQAGDVRRETTTERLGWEVPWLHRIVEALSAKPALTGVFGAAACALVLGGVLYAERLNMPTMAEEGAASPMMALSGSAPRLSPFGEPLTQDSLAQPQLASSTNPVPAGLFGPRDLGVQQVIGRPQLPFSGN